MGSHCPTGSGRWDEHIAAGLSRIHVAMRLHDRRQRGFHAHASQTLLVLACHGQNEMTAGDLAAHLGVTFSLVPNLPRILERRGVIHPFIQEGRAGLIRLTAKGRRKAARLSRWPDHVAAMTSSLSDAQQGQLLTVVEGTIVQLLRRGHISLEDMCGTCTFFRSDVHADSQQPHHCMYVDIPLPLRASEEAVPSEIQD